MRLLAFGIFLLALLPLIFLNPYVGVLLYSWISFMSPHRLIWGFPNEIPLALITAILTLTTWVLSKEPKRIPINTTTLLIILFMVWISITTFCSLNPVTAWVRWDRTIKVLGFVLITIALTRNRVRCVTLLWVMAIAIGYYGLKGGVFALLNGGQYRAYGPPDTAIADNNDLAAGLVVALPIMNYVRITCSNRFSRMVWGATIVFSILAIVSTYSRAGFLGLSAVAVMIWLKGNQKIWSAILFAGALGAALFLMPPQYFSRLGTIENYAGDASAMGRIEIWGTALRIGLARPLTGGGFGATESQSVVNHYQADVEARAVHNVFLSVLSDHGVPGLAIWGSLLLMGWLNSRWLLKSTIRAPDLEWMRRLAQMLQASLIGYCVVGCFGNYAYWDYFFTLIGLLAALRIMAMSYANARDESALARSTRPRLTTRVSNPLRLEQSGVPIVRRH